MPLKQKFLMKQCNTRWVSAFVHFFGRGGCAVCLQLWSCLVCSTRTASSLTSTPCRSIQAQCWPGAFWGRTPRWSRSATFSRSVWSLQHFDLGMWVEKWVLQLRDCSESPSPFDLDLRGETYWPWPLGGGLTLPVGGKSATSRLFEIFSPWPWPEGGGGGVAILGDCLTLALVVATVVSLM